MKLRGTLNRGEPLGCSSRSRGSPGVVGLGVELTVCVAGQWLSGDLSSEALGTGVAVSGPWNQAACPFWSRGRQSGLGGVSALGGESSGRGAGAPLNCGGLQSTQEFREKSSAVISLTINSGDLEILSVGHDEADLILIAWPLFKSVFPSKLFGPSWRGTFLISKLKFRSNFLSIWSTGDSFFPGRSADLL